MPSKVPLPYIVVHDGMPDHPKIDALSDAAFRLLVSSWCWCSRHLTDGCIEADVWVRRGTPATRGQLVAKGLVELDAAGNARMHDYLQWQRSADEVAAMREKKQAAGRLGGLAKAVAGASPSAKQTSSRTVPYTETTTEEVETSSTSSKPRKRATQPPARFEITDVHRAWAAEHTPHVTNLVVQAAKMCDHFRGKGETRKDWDATFRTWLRNQEEWTLKDLARQGPRRATGGGVYDDADEVAWR